VTQLSKMCTCFKNVLLLLIDDDDDDVFSGLLS